MGVCLCSLVHGGDPRRQQGSVGRPRSFHPRHNAPGLTALRERWALIYNALVHKYWIDELYDALFVRPVYLLAVWFWKFWDVVVVDGLVNGIGYTFEGFSALLRLFQTGFVGTYALFFTLGVAALLFHLLRHHP